MVNVSLARLREPRSGMVACSAVVALLMAVHWRPMTFPGLLLIGLIVLRPQIAVRPIVWWVMAGLWLGALVLVQDRMEDHVYLFAVWLVALAISLGHDDDASFVDHAAWHARVLIGVTFSAAVGWKLYFGEFLTGTALWVFILVDGRFAPLARMVGLSETAIAQHRAGLREVLEGTAGTLSLDSSSAVLWRISGMAAFALLLESLIAASYLLPDSNRLAALRLPSIVLFAVITYALVPVIFFAALLAVLAMSAARWRREVLWVLPVMVIVCAIRLRLLS